LIGAKDAETFGSGDGVGDHHHRESHAKFVLVFVMFFFSAEDEKRRTNTIWLLKNVEATSFTRTMTCRVDRDMIPSYLVVAAFVGRCFLLISRTRLGLWASLRSF